MTKSCAADGVDPGRLVVLGEFDKARRYESEGRDVQRCGARLEEAPTQKNHECPKRVAGILAKDCGKQPREFARSKAKDDDSEQSESQPDSIALHGMFYFGMRLTRRRMVILR